MIPAWALPRMTIRPWMTTRGAHPPGIGPLAPEEWLQTDATYGAQMALRDDLARTRPEAVVACLPQGEAAATELLGVLVDELTARHGARVEEGVLIRADGGRVPLDSPPMAAICRAAQEDFLILQRAPDEAEHVLTAGALCFPANWVLTEKIGKALLRIHLPVREYDGPLASRVQRLHDGVAAGRPLIRANWNFALTPDLHTPTPEAEKMARRESRAAPTDWRGGWIRVERQCLSRLPVSGAVVFAVRTLIAPLTGCADQDWIGFHRAIGELPEEIRASKAGPAIVAEAARRAGA
ncbi:MAG: hypothetical protein ACJA1L_001868 [Paracoccaceae bacterium]|jgi:hypothetical protein